MTRQSHENILNVKFKILEKTNYLSKFLNIHMLFLTLFSVLCLENLPDPQRTHFLWGMSKDFGLASFRFGVLHTLNPNLIKIMEGMCLYSSVEGHIQQIGGQMLKGRIIHKLH